MIHYAFAALDLGLQILSYKPKKNTKGQANVEQAWGSKLILALHLLIRAFICLADKVALDMGYLEEEEEKAALFIWH